jgi:hypothetical protein
MSWEIFKNNILNVANNPDQIRSIEQVAELYAREYDAAIKRGKDTVHGVPLQKGNVEAMKQLFVVALQKGLTSKQPYDLVGEMGKGVLAYWTSGTMYNTPIPIIPAVGAVVNVAVISNSISNPGQWQPPQSLGGQPNFEMSEEQKQGAKEDLESAKQELAAIENDPEVSEDIKEAAKEQISYQETRLATNENYSVDDEDVRTPPIRTEIPLDGGVTNPIQVTTNTPSRPADEPQGPPPNVAESDIGKRIVAYANMDVGKLENPLPPGKPENWGPYVSSVLAGVGHKAPAFWCAAAVSSWFKSAGAKSPNSAGCDQWVSWAKKNGLWSTTPAIGAAILYGTPADAHHIGIVESVDGNIVKTIEGNTSGGGFSRNGVGVFKKKTTTAKALGYVLPVKK